LRVDATVVSLNSSKKEDVLKRSLAQ